MQIGFFKNMPAMDIEFDEPRHDYVVLMHLVPAVINADPQELTDAEELQLNEFLVDHGEHWLVVFDIEYPDDPVQYMAKCDVTGKIGWCCEIKTN